MRRDAGRADGAQYTRLIALRTVRARHRLE
jgi:hypothetical protein